MKTTNEHHNRRPPIAALAIVMVTLMGIFSPLFGETASLSFSETYKRNLLCTKVTKKCKEVNADYFSAAFQIPLTNVQAAAVNQNTVIEVRLGSIQFKQKLGSAFVASTKTATITSYAKNTVGKVAGKRTLKVQVLPDKLVCSVQASTSDLKSAKWKSVFAGDLASKKAGKYKRSFPATIKIGESSYSFTVNSWSTVQRKKVKGKDGKSHNLPTVSLKGSGSRTVNIEILPVLVGFGTDSPAGGGSIGNGGGTLNISTGPLTGVSVAVPPGSLSADTQIMLASNNIILAPRAGSFSGSALNLHTDRQTSFEEPFTITIPFNPASNAIPIPYYVTEDGFLRPCQIQSIDRVNGTMTFQTFHASLFTWILSQLTSVTNLAGHSSYSPADGFQVVNTGSIYNPGGECFGMASFAQWFYAKKGGGLYPKYMADIPFQASSLKGQQIIATRAHTSVSRLWNEYIPTLTETLNLSGAEVYSGITNILDNTARPTILYLNQLSGGRSGAHAVLAYDHVGSGTIMINDPNYPGVARSGTLSAAGSLTYGDWGKVAIIGEGSFRTEAFDNIYDDAESGFSGSGRAQVVVNSHTDGEDVTDRTIQLSGNVSSGVVLVDKLVVWLNGTIKFEEAIGSDGSFSLAINLVSGENRFTFETSGTDTNGNRVQQLNDQVAPFVIDLVTPLSQVLITLTWNTDDTDIDLYTIDPTGDYSAYYNKVTSDGGELDYDNTRGFGPEHWTLDSTDTVRWGEEYDVRVHYYSDHASDSRPTRWNVSVLLYEGTPNAVNYNYTGVLSVDNSSNRDHTDTGPDWADVCTFVPVQATVAGALAAPRMESSPDGRPRIIVPMPSEAELLRLKAASRAN